MTASPPQEPDATIGSDALDATIGSDALAGAHAVGWATVDIDRASHALAPLLRPGTAFRETHRSQVLGARCRFGEARGPGPPVIVLLEPDTEGRIAGALARFGEGWVATWFHAPTGHVPEPDGGPGVDGPLGPEWLDRRHRPDPRYPAVARPFRLMLPTATIER